jgi:hypothetical protein
MAGTWEQSDNLDDFESILGGNSFDPQSLNDDALNSISQAVEVPAVQFIGSTPRYPPSNPPTSQPPPSTLQQPQSALSSVSPESSTHDSSSDSSGRRKRKTSSASSPTAYPNMNNLKVSERKLGEDAVMSHASRSVLDSGYTLQSPSNTYPLEGNMDFNDNSMNSLFDLNSAAASPGMFGPGDLGAMTSSEQTVVPPNPKKPRSGPLQDVCLRAKK